MFFSLSRGVNYTATSIEILRDKARLALRNGARMSQILKDKVEEYRHFLYLLFMAPNVDRASIGVSQLVEKLDVPMETHTVTTDDGYIIQIHRIPGSGPPVFLQHGLLCSSACWVTSGEASLAYLLHQQGYDVWMGNVRGNRYGYEHSTTSPENEDFWKYTFHHFGQYDLPAIIEKAYTVSGKRKITYIGHSMGCTMMMVCGSQRPEILDMINLVILLAPVAAGHGMTSPLKGLSFLHRHHKILLEWMGIYTLPPEIPGARWVTNRPLYPLFSYQFLKSFTGFLDEYVGSQEMVEHLPSTVSIYTLLHFSQNINEKCFQAYDWMCPDENRRHYGNPIPPVYQTEKFTAPVAIFCATKDTLSPPSELEELPKILPNVVHTREVDLTHLGFLWSRSAKLKVYRPIMELIREYNS